MGDDYGLVESNEGINWNDSSAHGGWNLVGMGTIKVK